MQTAKALSMAYTAVWRESNAIYESWAKERGLSYYELLVLLSLVEEGDGTTSRDLCEHWVLPKQTVHSILRNFIQRSWVVMDADGRDRRSKRIQLTEMGRKRGEEISQALLEREAVVWAAMGESDGRALVELTDRFNRLFREAGHVAP